MTMRRKKATPKAKKNDACPNCGYCPHCGRSEAKPVQPVYVPWGTAPWPYTWWTYTYPWNGSATVTIQNADLPATGSTISVPSVWTSPNTSGGATSWTLTTGDCTS